MNADRSRSIAGRHAPFAPVVAEDAVLMTRVGRYRDADAFAEILRRHQATASRMAYGLTRNRDESDEVVQEAFLQVWRHAGKFRTNGCVRNWILKIVANEAFRKRKRNRSNAEKKVRAQARGMVWLSVGPECCIERGELLGALRESLGTLPAEQVRALALYYAAGRTQMEISEVMGCSQNKISHLLSKAVIQLRASLSEVGCSTA